MNHNIKRIQRGAGAIVIAAALAGCGGGGGGGGGFFFPFPTGGGNPPPPPAQVDAYDAFIAYVVALVSTQPEYVEPANVAQFDPPPTSETKSPVATQ